MKKIRLWTMGSLEHKILPTKEGVQRLRNILSNNDGQETLELVWGPDLNVKTINVDTNEEVIDAIRTEFDKDGETYCKIEILNDTDTDSLATG